MSLRKRDVSERFWEKVDVTGECWEWLAGLNLHGYGQFGMYPDKPELAHRFAWMLLVGEIPEDMCVLHHCDNKRCVNPDHLFIGTRADNSRDMVKKGRQQRGSEVKMSKLTENEVLKIREIYNRGGILQCELAEIFNIGRTAISRIVNRKRWCHI